MAIVQPSFINIPFSNSGLKTNTIPNNDDSGVGNASWEQGFPPETMKQIAQGGVPPRGQDMNGVLNKVTSILQYLQSGTPFKYDSTFANSIDGYPKGALVLSTDGVTIWRNTTAGNRTDPDNGGTNWVNFLAQFGDYLPLVGGTMTGQIKSFNVNVPISIIGVGTNSYRDIEAQRDTGKRIGVVRFRTTGTTNDVLIGVSDAMNSAPSGITVSRTLGDGVTGGEITVTVSNTPATSDISSKIATTAYVKNCLPKSIGSSTKLTYTNSDGVLTASNANIGSSDIPVYMSSGTITASEKKFSDYLPLAGGTMTGALTLASGVRLYGTANAINIDSAVTAQKEDWFEILNKNPAQTTNTGGIVQYGAYQVSGTQNIMVGFRLGNPRAGNLPTSGTGVKTANCWDGLFVRYNYDTNQGYAYTGNPPSLDTTSPNYQANHLATVGNLKTALGDYLPLAGGTMTGVIKRTGDFVQNTGDSNWLRLSGATEYSKGAYLQLWGKDHTSNAGEFRLTASNGSSTINLVGYPDGRMTWANGLVFANNSIRRTGTSNWIRLTGGETDYTDGASLIVYGKIHSTNPGVFSLSAYDGTNRYNLTGSPNGRLSWTGNVHLAGDGVHGIDLSGQTIDLNTCYSSISGAVKLFHCNSDSGSSNISNCPENKAFLLVSFSPRRLSASDYVVHQHFYCIGAHYSRRCTSGTWTNWLLEVGASSASVGDANTPVYLNNGAITSTGKSFANYLPLAGGTMTGSIVVPRSALKLYSDTDELVIYGSSDADSKAACITLRGDSRSSEPGSFYIRAGDGTDYKVLLGKPDGTLTWNGSRIAYGTAGNANTPVYVNSSGVVTSTGKSFADYLPLAGGAMTGTAIYRNASNSYIALYGGTSNSDAKSGAYISLSGKDRADYGGTFRLSCTDGTSQQLLVGAIDSLSWNGAVPAVSDDSTKIATTAYVKDCVPKSRGSSSQPVYTNSNGVVTACTMNSSSAAGLTRITNQAFGVYGSNGQSDADNNTQGFHHGYVKFASGLIIQWGSLFVTTAGADVTFETPFVNKPQLTMSYNTGGDHLKGFSVISKTGFHAWVNTDSSAAQIKWMAIGV